MTETFVHMRKALGALSATVVILLICLPSFSQTSSGRILGIVTDQSGGVIPGATVTIIDTQRGTARTLATDDAGEYNAPELIPGTYTVRVEARGFKKLERENVALEVGQEVRVDVTVPLGERADTVTVTDATPLAVATNATVGGTLNNAEINDLPLNGRNYQSLMGLRPGVMLQPGGSPWTQSTNNIRPDETVWMVDGVINADFFDARPLAAMSSQFTDGATILPIDAIQEFNLEENPKAEYGWRPGAVVNVGIKSGTNQLHGSAYAFGRDDAWDARNVFNPGLANGVCVRNQSFPVVCDKLPTQLNQFGGVVGGPIKKEKLFFFAGYEGLRSFIGNALVGAVPETGAQASADPMNRMPDAIVALQKAPGFKGLCNGTNGPVCLSPVSLNLLGCTGAPTVVGSYSCTGGLIQGASANTTNYLSSFPNINTSDNGVAKIDYRVNSKHMINGMLFIGNYSGLGNDTVAVNQAWRSSIWIRTWTSTGNWIWTPSSRVVNEARASYNRMSNQVLSADDNKFANGTDYPLNTGITSTGGFPLIVVGAFSALGNPHRIETLPNPYADFQDNLSYLRGRHTFKFGGEFTQIEADSNVHQTQGIIFFGNTPSVGGQTPGLADCGGFSCPLEDFFAGNPFAGFRLIGNPNIKMTWRSIAGFVQDEWRFTPKIILNLGLRYSYVSPIKEVNGLLGNFDPVRGMVQQGQPSVSDTIIKPERRDFSPRVGLAWDVTGTGTTVVRAGASIIYSIFTPANFLAYFGFGGVSLAAVPTGADFVVANSGLSAATTTHGNGTIHLGTVQIPSANLSWNGVIFPYTAGNVQCGDGVTLTTGATDPGPCDLMAVDPNLRYPYVTNWNLSVQHAFASNLALDVGYVGNRGSRLAGILDLNQSPLGAGYCLNSPLTTAQLADACAGGIRYPANLASPQSEQEGRPYAARFPFLGHIAQISNDARSNYHSLQATLTKRLSHGLSFLAGYTYGHGLDNGSLNRFGGVPQNSSNPGVEYASSDFDVRHRFTFEGSYELPGKKGFGQLLQGWKINSIVTLESAQPWLVTGTDFSGTGDGADRWDFHGNTNDFRSGVNSIILCTGPGDGGANNGGCNNMSGIYGITLCGTAPGTSTTVPGACDQSTSTNMWNICKGDARDLSTLGAGGCFISGTSVMTPPALGTLGTMGRNIFRDSGFKNWDFSVFKTFAFKERYRAQFRVELFNLLNHPVFANPYGASNFSAIGNNPFGKFGCGCATPDYAAGNPIVGSGSNRVMQLGLKLSF